MGFSRSFSARKSEEPCRFGIPVLDESLGGGLARGAIILIEDEVGVNSAPFLIQFLSEGLQSGEYAYILGTEHMYDYYRQLLIPFGIEEIVVEMKRLVYLDAFTTPFGGKDIGGVRSDANTVKDLLQPRHVTDVINQATLHVRGENVRGVFDSLTTVLMISDDLKAPLSLFHNKIANDKKAGNVTAFTVHRDVHDPKVVHLLEHYADAVFRITREQRADDPAPTDYMEVVKGSLTGVKKFRYRGMPGKIELEPI